jgi:serine protease Do
MLRRILLCLALLSLTSAAQPEQTAYDLGENWAWSYGAEDTGGGSSYLGVDIADVTSERLSELKLKEEHGAEVTMVDQDAPAGKGGLHEHDVILSLNGATVESAAQLRRMIRETPPGRVVTLGISRDGQPLTLKVQLADRRKSRGGMFDPSDFNIQVSPMPAIPDIDVPVSIVVAHSSLRSGLMVENITPQLGEFFGVKNGNGVLIRLVEKGSRAEKAGFRAGDVIVKVNKQAVHDTSDFTHALRSSGGPASITVVREKKEQNLTLTLPERKDSGSLMEDSFALPEISAEAEREVGRVQDEIARMQPAIEQKLKEKTRCLKDLQQKLQDSQRKMQEQGEKLRHELSGKWTEI